MIAWNFFFEKVRLLSVPLFEHPEGRFVA